MSSVTVSEPCPNCKGAMMVDFDLRTGEEYQFCQRCGYHHSREMKRDDDNNVVMEKQDGKDVPVWVETREEGYGTFIIRNSQGVLQRGGFNEPITDEIIEQFKVTFAQEDVDSETSYLARFENSKIDVLLGNPNDINLLSYDELLKKMENERQKESTL